MEENKEKKKGFWCEIAKRDWYYDLKWYWFRKMKGNVKHVLMESESNEMWSQYWWMREFVKMTLIIYNLILYNPAYFSCIEFEYSFRLFIEYYIWNIIISLLLYSLLHELIDLSIHN